MRESTNRLIPLTDWNRYHVWPPQGGLRHLMFHRERNGFAPAFVKCGRRVLILEDAFFDCLQRRQDMEELCRHGSTN